MKWMAQKYADTSYYVPAHLERAGPFNPNGNNGYNIEHLRNFNNAAPTVAFGMETQPGHGASDARGEYTVHRNNFGGTIGNVDSVGGTTWGGTGVYGGQVGGVWDALLGEGRNWWFFASSDWHNRGMFGPDDRRSSQDFYPGEYQRNYVKVGEGKDRGFFDQHDKNKAKVLTPQAIVDGLRTGNSWASSGQLIDRLAFVVCADTRLNDAIGNVLIEAAAVAAAKQNTDVDLDAKCATLGEKLEVRAGFGSGGGHRRARSVRRQLLAVHVRRIRRWRRSASRRPLNKPVLDHIDVIGGAVTGYKMPARLTTPASGRTPGSRTPTWPPCPKARRTRARTWSRTFGQGTWKTVPGDKQYKTMVFRLRDVNESQYLRLRGTNLPASVPFETDADGNPLADLWTNATAINPTLPGGADGTPANANLRIPCTTVGTNVPDHRGDVHRYDDRRLPGASAGGQRPEVLGLRRGGVVGPVVLQQSGLHRSEGLVAGRRRQVSLQQLE